METQDRCAICSGPFEYASGKPVSMRADGLYVHNECRPEPLPGDAEIRPFVKEMANRFKALEITLTEFIYLRSILEMRVKVDDAYKEYDYEEQD